MKNQIIIPSEYHSFLFDQKTKKKFIAGAHLIGENAQHLKDYISSKKPPDWLPPYKHLCLNCHIREADMSEYCFLCDMVIQKKKELFDLPDEKQVIVPDSAVWIYHPEPREEFIPAEGTVLILDNNHSCLFIRRNKIYDCLFNSPWHEVNLVVVELNRTVKHIGNTLLMAQHHAVHIQRSGNIAVKFIFAGSQIYSSDFIYDASLVLSREDLRHVLSGVDELRLNFDYQYTEQMISYFHETQEDKEYLKNKILQLCSLKQKEALFMLGLFEMPKNFALLILKLARLFNG